MELPALARAHELQERAARLGWQPDQAETAPRLAARLVALDALADDDSRNREAGTVLFELAGLARRLGINAESALREANARFVAEFKPGGA